MGLESWGAPDREPTSKKLFDAGTPDDTPKKRKGKFDFGGLPDGVPPEQADQIKALLGNVNDILEMLVVAYNKAKNNPTDQRAAQEFMAMLTDLMKVPHVCVAILSIGISAAAELMKDGE